MPADVQLPVAAGSVEASGEGRCITVVPMIVRQRSMVHTFQLYLITVSPALPTLA